MGTGGESASGGNKSRGIGKRSVLVVTGKHHKKKFDFSCFPRDLGLHLLIVEVQELIAGFPEGDEFDLAAELGARFQVGDGRDHQEGRHQSL